MATSDTAKMRQEIEQLFGQVPTWVNDIPDAAAGGFWAIMRDFQLGQTRIPNKYKELIGLGVSGATRCRYCALFHTEAARLFGATDEEIAEASMMAGFTMAASTFLNAQLVDYDTFRRETLDIVNYVRSNQTREAHAVSGAQPGMAGAHA